MGETAQLRTVDLVSSHSPDLRPLIIVGSGPAGYTAALYAARAQLRPLLFEGSVTAGGALMTTTEVENFPGFPDGIHGPELMDRLRTQAEQFGAELIADDIVDFSLTGTPKSVTDSSATTHEAAAVILATGSSYRHLGLPGEQELSGRGVSWCATCDGFFFRGADIAVVGGGDSAAEEAQFLTKFADHVHLLVRGEKMRASAIMAQRVTANPKISIHYNTNVLALQGTDKLTGLRIGTPSGQRDLCVTGLFVAIGHDPRSALFSDQVDVDAEGYVEVRGRGTHTNLPGVFACGDLVDRHYRQAITAAGSGCAAALDAERYLADTVAPHTSGPA